MILEKYYIEVTMAEIIARVDMIFFEKMMWDIKDQDILDQNKISSQPKISKQGRSE